MKIAALFSSLALLLPLAAHATPEDEQFEKIANGYIEQYLERNPEEATALGDHRFDSKLTDYSPDAFAKARAAAYALMRPSREILFTVLRREDKYKVKGVTDTLGYRTGDQLGAWSYGGMHGLGLGLSSISFIAVPVVVAWCALSIWLGRKQGAMALAQAKPS